VTENAMVFNATGSALFDVIPETVSSHETASKPGT